MFKILISSLVFFLGLSFAQNTNEINEIEKCEQTYDECSQKCEQSNIKNNEECYSKCEVSFDDCQNKIPESQDTESEDEKDLDNTEDTKEQ